MCHACQGGRDEKVTANLSHKEADQHLTIPHTKNDNKENERKGRDRVFSKKWTGNLEAELSRHEGG